jgi:hypothetical protein
MWLIHQKYYSTRLLNDVVIALLAQPPTDRTDSFLFICSMHWPSYAFNEHKA